MQKQNIEFLKRMARGIVGVFGKRCEVVIHDFNDITRSVVHIEGNVTNRSVGAPVTSGSSESEREVYTRAFDLMKARQFDESARAFDQLIVSYPNGQYTPNAFYWLGELYLAQSDSEQARQSFAQVLNLYPDHPKVPDSLYKMGVVYHRLGDNAGAIEYFERAAREYPNSSAAGLATRYMAELK